MKISLKLAKLIGEELGVNFDVVPVETLRHGMQVESEHGRYKRLNVVDHNPVMIAKIALAHMVEFPDYYVRLDKMESQAKKYWSRRNKPKIFI